MAFLITMPNGKKYRVEGAATQNEALQHLQQQLQATNTPADPVAADAQAQMSAMTQHPGAAIAEQRRQQDVADYAALPAWKRPVADVVDLVNTSGRAATGLVTGTLGLGSRALAATGVGTPVISVTPEEIVARFKSGQSSGPAFDAEVAKQKRQTEAARNRLQWAAPIAEAAPLMMAPVAKVAEGLPLLNTLVSGAGYGAATAAGNKEDPLLGAAGGAAGAAGGHVLGQGLGYLLNKGLGYAGKALESVAPSLAAKTGLKVPALVPVPTKEEFKAASTAAFKEADSHGIVFNRDGLDHLRQNIKDDIGDWWTPENEPGTVPALRKLYKYLDSGSITFQKLRMLRRTAQNGFRPGMTSNNAAVSAIINHIDDLNRNMDPRFMSAASNNPQAAEAAAKLGRETFAKSAKLDTIHGMMEHAERQGKTNVSQNVPQLKQKQLVKINDPTLSVGRGFTKAEKEAADVAAERTGQLGLMHDLSAMRPRGKLMAAVHAAPLFGGLIMGGGPNPLGLALAAGGMGARMLVGHMAEKRLQKLVDRSVQDLVRLIASGGAPTQSILQRLTASKRAAVLAGLGRAGMGFGNAAANQFYGANSQNEPAHP